MPSVQNSNEVRWNGDGDGEGGGFDPDDAGQFDDHGSWGDEGDAAQAQARERLKDAVKKAASEASANGNGWGSVSSECRPDSGAIDGACNKTIIGELTLNEQEKHLQANHGLGAFRFPIENGNTFKFRFGSMYGTKKILDVFSPKNSEHLRNKSKEEIKQWSKSVV